MSLYYGDILLRFPSASVGRIQKDVDWYVTEPVPASDVDAMVDGEWVSLL